MALKMPSAQPGQAGRFMITRSRVKRDLWPILKMWLIASSAYFNGKMDDGIKLV
jgi:hypothetical protein